MRNLSRQEPKLDLNQVYNTLQASDPQDFVPGSHSQTSVPALHEIMTALLDLPETEREAMARRFGAFEPPNLLAAGLVYGVVNFNQLDTWGPRGIDAAQAMYRSVVKRTAEHQDKGGYIPRRQIVNDLRAAGYESAPDEIEPASQRLQHRTMITQRDRAGRSEYYRLVDPVRAVLMGRRDAVYLDRTISEAPEEVHAAGKLFWIITSGGIRGDGRERATLSELANLIVHTDPPVSEVRSRVLEQDEVLASLGPPERAAVIAQRLGSLPLFKMSPRLPERWIRWQ